MAVVAHTRRVTPLGMIELTEDQCVIRFGAAESVIVDALAPACRILTHVQKALLVMRPGGRRNASVVQQIGKISARLHVTNADLMWSRARRRADSVSDVAAIRRRCDDGEASGRKQHARSDAFTAAHLQRAR